MDEKAKDTYFGAKIADDLIPDGVLSTKILPSA
jgi:hypothetical protein